MPALPEGWKLKEKKRPDGKVDLIGKDATGNDYVARTTDTGGVTDRDLQILAVGNRDTSSAAELVKFYQAERENYNKAQADAMTDSYMDGAEQVVRAGLHLSESRVGYSRSYALAWERAFGEEN
jgi:phosphoglucomutase